MNFHFKTKFMLDIRKMLFDFSIFNIMLRKAPIKKIINSNTGFHHNFLFHFSLYFKKIKI